MVGREMSSNLALFGWAIVMALITHALGWYAGIRYVAWLIHQPFYWTGFFARVSPDVAAKITFMANEAYVSAYATARASSSKEADAFQLGCPVKNCAACKRQRDKEKAALS
jgi:hypothetical protein